MFCLFIVVAAAAADDSRDLEAAGQGQVSFDDFLLA